MKRTLVFAMIFALAACTGPSSRDSASRNERVETLVNLGTGYLRAGDYPRAKEHLNRALEADPRSASAHNAIALVFQLEQDYEIAEDHFRQALRSMPDATQVRNNYGAFLYERGRYEEAAKQLRTASEDRYYEGRATVFENLGLVYLRLGDRQAARQAFERAVALNPDQPKAMLELAELQFEQQSYADARRLYHRYQRVSGSPTARSLWLCIRLAGAFEDADQKASCSLALRNLFPGSDEYRQYRELTQ